MSGRIVVAGVLAVLAWAGLAGWAAACPDWRQYGERLTYSAEDLWTPRSHGVVAGGDVDLAGCDMPGVGHVAVPPDFTLSLSGNDAGLDLEFRAEAGCDAVLLVNDAGGGWHFSDDDDGSPDPRIRLSGAGAGVYDAWVGTYDAATCAAELVLETFGGTGTSVAGTGTGFVVSADGWVLTNAHVVEGCGRVEVAGMGAATRVVIDGEADLAAVHLGHALEVAPLPLRSNGARLAESVLALGFPLAEILSPSVRVTSGSVNALTGVGGREGMIQFSAPIQPGNSGGPVMDNAGLVLGVVTATLSEGAYERAQNVNFAVTATDAMRFLLQNGIGFTARDGTQAVRLDVSEVAELAAAVTLLLRCE